MADMLNRVHNSTNPNQGKFKRVLCVCSAGLLRSPTVAYVLSQEPYNYNTRAAGIEESYALIPVDQVLLSWAQEIVCVSKSQKRRLEDSLIEFGYKKPVVCLDIPDNFEYRDPELIAAIKAAYAKYKEHS